MPAEWIRFAPASSGSTFHRCLKWQFHKQFNRMPRTKKDPLPEILSGFGSRLRQAREAEGLSMRELGELIGSTHALIGRIESGKRLPRLQDVAKLCLALRVRAGWLVAGEPPLRGRAVTVMVENDGPDSLSLQSQLLGELNRVKRGSSARNG